jgi:hypothetical protein
MVAEELSENMESFRSRYLSELSLASQDTDYQRSSRRLCLLAGAGITEVLELSSRHKMRSRDILEVLLLLKII